jgi:hypothetical protein
VCLLLKQDYLTKWSLYSSKRRKHGRPRNRRETGQDPAVEAGGLENEYRENIMSLAFYEKIEMVGSLSQLNLSSFTS